MKYYHGTTEDRAENIKQNNFKLPNEDSLNRFGQGIYFSSSKEVARDWGEYVIKVDVSSSQIHFMNYIDLKELYPWLNIEEEEGVPKLEEHIKELGYHAVSLKYQDKTEELIVYEPSILKINNIEVVKRSNKQVLNTDFEQELKKALEENN